MSSKDCKTGKFRAQRQSLNPRARSQLQEEGTSLCALFVGTPELLVASRMIPELAGKGFSAASFLSFP